MKRIHTIIGARPQIIKAAALSRAIRQTFSSDLQETIIHTGQHYDDNMSEVFFRELGIPHPDHNLSVGSGLHGDTTARMIAGIEKILLTEKPDGLVVYGDTNSTLGGAIAASKIGIPVAHIEAGLRSFNKSMPEEINRIVCDHCSTLLFSPTAAGVNNLRREGFAINRPPYHIDRPGVFHCGDIMYDNSLHFAAIAAQNSNILENTGLVSHPFILSTIHRNANTDDPARLKYLLTLLKEIQDRSHLPLVLPLHPRTRKLAGEHQLNDLLREMIVIEPVSFLDMIMLEKSSSLIITDSGGVQKEAYFFRKPSLILRQETEWVEIIESGNAELEMPDSAMMVKKALSYIENPPLHFPGIFGDGHAAEFICRTMVEQL